MNCRIRKWELSDAKDLAAALSNTKIQDNLRDGLPYPYTEQDGIDYISAMLSADENDTFAFAITVEGKVIGSIGVYASMCLIKVILSVFMQSHLRTMRHLAGCLKKQVFSMREH